jgi:transcription factor CON7
MAQPPSPSKSSLQDAPNESLQSNNSRGIPSNPDPIDPSIAQQSPTYPPYSPYGDQNVQHGYPPQGHGGYMPPRPHDQGGWGGYPQQHNMPGPYQHPGAVQGPPPTSGGARPGGQQVRARWNQSLMTEGLTHE